MKTSLDHLPEDKQHQLRWATDIIRDAVKPGMLILFGSYARGDWQEERAADGVHYQYQSDFDLLAIVKNEAIVTKIERKSSLYNDLSRLIKTPVSLIAEDIHFFNRRLEKGHYFYTDILKEGILLHDSGKFELAEPRMPSLAERRQQAEQDFQFWFTSAKEYFLDFQAPYNRGNYANAAFLLHQVTERLYSTVLLVFTNYKPNSHDLEKLSRLVASIEPQFLTIFPQGTDADKQKFELLRKAYVNARYKPSYKITREELDWLVERVQELQTMTEQLCKEKIESFNA